MKEVTDELVRNEWQCRRAGGHAMWACPCGQHQLTIAGTPSSRRLRNNVKTAIRRCRRSAE